MTSHSHGDSSAIGMLLHNARRHHVAGEREARDRCIEAAQQSSARNAASASSVGDFCSGLELYPAALNAYARAAALAPGESRYAYNLAVVQRFVGDLRGAQDSLDRAIALNPHDGEAWHLRSDLFVQSIERNHIPALEDRIRSGFEAWPDEVPVRFALAKEYEDVGRYDDAWRELLIAAALRRRHLQYDLSQDLATVDWIRAAFPDRVVPAASAPPASPIFIVGMPRTGTTLLERILGSHPEVFAAGELVDFAAAVVNEARRAAGTERLSRPALIAASARSNFGRLGQEYLARVAHRTDRPRLLDKMPLNYLYAGIIHRALPNARIVHMTRHPIANCHAILKTLFAQGYPFSYDLRETAEYYAAYWRLMAHWHEVMPGQICEVAYEQLVADPAGEARRIYAFCGLEWQDKYLQSAPAGWSSSTASASQVRREIYRRSVDLWRHYELQLEPVRQCMSERGVPC